MSVFPNCHVVLSTIAPTNCALLCYPLTVYFGIREAVWLERWDLNPRNAGVKVPCLATWLRSKIGLFIELKQINVLHTRTLTLASLYVNAVLEGTKQMRITLL